MSIGILWCVRKWLTLVNWYAKMNLCHLILCAQPKFNGCWRLLWCFAHQMNVFKEIFVYKKVNYVIVFVLGTINIYPCWLCETKLLSQLTLSTELDYIVCVIANYVMKHVNSLLMSPIQLLSKSHWTNWYHHNWL